MRTHLLAVALIAIALPAGAAQVYRCADAEGRIEYRDTPCARDQSGGLVNIEPNLTTGIDPHVVQSESNAIAARAAARVAADEDAARARAQAHGLAEPGTNGTPWWMINGPPPERANGQKSGSDYYPPAAKR